MCCQKGLTVGDALTIETPDGRVREVGVTGIAYDANAFPAAFVGAASGYVDRETFERLGGGSQLLSGFSAAQWHARAIAGQSLHRGRGG